MSLSELVSIAANRACLFSTVLSLSKWSETYDEYKRDILGSLGGDPKQLRNRIAERGILELRHPVVAHARSDKLGRPWTNTEIDEWVAQRGGLDAHFDWIAEIVPDVERVREAIVNHFALTEDDL